MRSGKGWGRGFWFILLAGLAIFADACSSDSAARDSGIEGRVGSDAFKGSDAGTADGGADASAHPDGRGDADDASSGADTLPDVHDATDGAALDMNLDSSAAGDTGASADAAPEVSPGVDALPDGQGGTGGDAQGDAADPAASYLCGSSALAVPPDSGVGTVLASLGLQSPVTGLWSADDRVAAAEYTGGWILWDSVSGLEVASSMSGTPLGLAGGILAVGASDHISTLSAVSGAAVGTISITPATRPFPPGDNGIPGLGLAADGSYVWIASTTSLSVWSPSGAPLGTRAGDYSNATVYGAPGHLLVALGPAGANVIEDVVANAGTATTSPTFSGAFASWFTDGKGFLSSVGNNVFAYTEAASLIQLVPVSAVGKLGGGGLYFWNSKTIGIDIYQLGGNGQPVHSYGALWAIGSMQRLAIYVEPSFVVVSLDAPSFTEQAVDLVGLRLPSTLSQFVADSNGDWSVGGQYGVVYHQGTRSAPGQSGRLGCGQVLGLTGSASGTYAIGTSAGDTLVLDLPGGRLDARLPLVAGFLQLNPNFEYVPILVNYGIQLSRDGRTLAAAVSNYAYVSGADHGLYIYSAPSWGIADSFPLAAGDLDFNMSSDGSTLARTVYSSSSQQFQTDVTDISGATSILSLSVTGGSTTAPRLSPNGTGIAITDQDRVTTSATRLYQGGTLVNAISGTAIGWLDDDHLIVQNYVAPPSPAFPPKYGSTSVYDARGNLLSSPPLPAIVNFDVVNASQIFSHTDQNIYDVTTGAVIKATGLSPQSIVVGPFIVSVVGRALQAMRY